MLGSLGLLYVTYVCPSSECSQAFLGVFHTEGRYDDALILELHAVYPKVSVSYKCPEHIKAISPEFETLYQQALRAEAYDLPDAAGPCARKALEFLVKDYAKHKIKEAAAGSDVSAELLAIDKTPLQAVINEHVDSKKINDVVSRATWIGNDEVHYIRKWENEDFQSLKKLIGLTVSFLDHEAEAEVMIGRMPKP